MSAPRHKLGRAVIVGAGLAGASAAAGLREHGFDGEVVLFGQERHRPYELPPLSKAILLGERDEPDWVHAPDFYDQHDIDFRPGTHITSVWPDEHLVVDASGVQQPYDRLLLATGSRPRRLPLPGAELAGLHLLRTLDDALALRSWLVSDARVVIVGAGWIGCEVAAAARKHDAQVTMIDPLPQPLYSVLGEQVGAVFRDLHAAHDVQLRPGTAVAGFSGDEVGEVRAVRLADCTELAADVVVIGVGAVPRLELAQRAGLTLAGGGVAVDPTLATSHPDIYAAGDIAAQDHPRYGGRVRVEHWANAKDHGSHVAANLLGANAPYTASPFFFSDQYDLGCEYRGLADPHEDQLVIRGDLAAREFIAFWLRDGHVMAAMNVNSWDYGPSLQALVDAQQPANPDQLRTGDLDQLAHCG